MDTTERENSEDRLHEIKESFYRQFSELVARHADMCASANEVGDALVRMQESASVYGSAWTEHSTKWKPASIHDLLTKYGR